MFILRTFTLVESLIVCLKIFLNKICHRLKVHGLLPLDVLSLCFPFSFDLFLILVLMHLSFRYLTMLSKATSEGIVVKVTNMYDYFFVCSGETKAKVTAMHLPYFDGDYWPGAAEDMLFLLQDEENGRRQQKKGKTKTATKRSSKGAAQAELLSNASKDLQLMQKVLFFCVTNYSLT